MLAVDIVVILWSPVIMLVSVDKELTHIIDFTCSRKTIYSLVCTQKQNLTPNTPDHVEYHAPSHGDLLNYILKQRHHLTF